MARIELAVEIVHDLDRIIEHLHQHEVDDASIRIRQIIAAIDVLEHSPLIGRPEVGRPGIGRPGPEHQRELVIGRGSRGYLALYRYIPEIDTVFILAIRSQIEAGYADPA